MDETDTADADELDVVERRYAFTMLEPIYAAYRLGVHDDYGPDEGPDPYLNDDVDPLGWGE